MDNTVNVNAGNWHKIKCGATLIAPNGREWTVVWRSPHNGMLDVAPLGAANGREARLVLTGNAIVVQTNWDEVKNLAGTTTNMVIPPVGHSSSAIA